VETRRERGQASIEWVALVALVAGLLLAILAVGPLRRGATHLGTAIAEKIVCAVRSSGSCDPGDPIGRQYGDEVAMLVHRYAPGIVYEPGTEALPVDFRSCRSPDCGDAADATGPVERSRRGEPVTAFVRVVDWRPSGGSLYLQYWLYYADSATGRGIPIVGSKGYHHDDWEGMQVRVGADGEAEARASSHHGYSHDGGPRQWAADTGLVPHSAWGSATGWLWVSGGSHAGRLVRGPGVNRYTPAEAVHLVPLESVAPGSHEQFAIDPPWRKPVYTDPESTET
jgi:hypothetical protein